MPLAAKALLAGAALLAGTRMAPAQAEAPPQPDEAGPEQFAMAVPRLALRRPGEEIGAVTLPHPLGAADAARARRVLELIATGDGDGAADEIGRMDDDVLFGDLLAARYLMPNAKPAPDRLRAWLRSFSDLPDAPAIYALLNSVSARNAKLDPAPSAAVLGDEAPAAPMPEEADPLNSAFNRQPALDHAVQARLDGTPHGVDQALRVIASARRLDPLYAAQLRAEVALRTFGAGGDDARAFAIAEAAFNASRGRNGLAGYVAGLAAWRMRRFGQAGPLFERASGAALAAPNLRAGAAYWAARARAANGSSDEVRPWLQRAAATPHTFYGMLAARMLGHRSWDRSPGAEPVAGTGTISGASDTDGPSPGTPVLSEVDVDAVAGTPAGKRFFAFLQIGDDERAEATLRRLWPMVQHDLALCRSIQLVAEQAGLDRLSAQLATMLQHRDGAPRDRARFPVPPLRPRHGFQVERALVYALSRLESNFDAGAVSGAGAHGMMQLMPETAGFVLGQPDRFTADASPLHDASLNLEIGQRYLSYLAKQEPIHGDLIRLLASYNLGPGAVARWDAPPAAAADPLMFIESLPNDETRDYVHRAFTYLWIYADRLGTASPSLETLARGGWPSFDGERNPGITLH